MSCRYQSSYDSNLDDCLGVVERCTEALLPVPDIEHNSNNFLSTAFSFPPSFYFNA